MTSSPSSLPSLFTRTAVAAALMAAACASPGQQTGPAPAAKEVTKEAAPDAASPLVLNRGRLLFLRCASCHATDDRSVAKTGPTMKGVFGRPAASLPGFGYSAALKSRALVWDAATLDRWIEKPTQLAPETTMAFIGLPDAADRQALIAYLQTLK